jgi:hypothetical protein
MSLILPFDSFLIHFNTLYFNTLQHGKKNFGGKEQCGPEKWKCESNWSEIFYIFLQFYSKILEEQLFGENLCVGEFGNLRR